MHVEEIQTVVFRKRTEDNCSDLASRNVEVCSVAQEGRAWGKGGRLEGEGSQTVQLPRGSEAHVQKEPSGCSTAPAGQRHRGEAVSLGEDCRSKRDADALGGKMKATL